MGNILAFLTDFVSIYDYVLTEETMICFCPSLRNEVVVFV